MKEQWLEVWSRYRGVRVGWGGRFVQMTAKHFIKLNWISAGSNKPYLWYIWYISEFYNLFIAQWIDSWSSNLKTVARVKTFLAKIQHSLAQEVTSVFLKLTMRRWEVAMMTMSVHPRGRWEPRFFPSLSQRVNPPQSSGPDLLLGIKHDSRLSPSAQVFNNVLFLE